MEGTMCCRKVHSTYVMIRRRWFFPLKWGSGKRKNIFVSCFTRKENNTIQIQAVHLRESDPYLWPTDYTRPMVRQGANNTINNTNNIVSNTINNTNNSMISSTPLEVRPVAGVGCNHQYPYHEEVICSYLSLSEVVGKVLHGICPDDGYVLVLHVPQSHRQVDISFFSSFLVLNSNGRSMDQGRVSAARIGSITARPAKPEATSREEGKETKKKQRTQLPTRLLHQGVQFQQEPKDRRGERRRTEGRGGTCARRGTSASGSGRSADLPRVLAPQGDDPLFYILADLGHNHQSTHQSITIVIINCYTRPLQSTVTLDHSNPS